MADISKGTNNHCPSRMKCYRYRSIGNPTRQAFADFEHSLKTGKCEYFWDVQGYHSTQLLTPADADRVIARMKSK